MSSSLRELYLARLREFYRQPARIFWVYGFPLVLAIGLGYAFRNPSTPTVALDLVAAEAGGLTGTPAVLTEIFGADDPIGRLLRLPGVETKGKDRLLIPGRSGRPTLDIRRVTAQEGEKRVTTGKTALLVIPGGSTPVRYRFDPTRPEASAARSAFDDTLQSANGRREVVPTADHRVTENGSRYIDFLIPGLIGQNTMGGGCRLE